MRILSKSDYDGYLEIDVSTYSWAYDPVREVSIRNHTHLDFEICNEDHLSHFVGSQMDSIVLTMEYTKSLNFFCPNDP